MRSYLSKHMPQAPLSDDEKHRMAAAAWHQQGIACIAVDEVTDPWAKQIVTNLANGRYGKRRPDLPPGGKDKLPMSGQEGGQ